MSRYVVGIDLGTTNSATSLRADTKEVAEDATACRRSVAFPIPQVVGVGRSGRPAGLAVVPLSPRPRKNSPAGALELPWSVDQADRVAGSFAQGARGEGAGPARQLGQELALT